MRANSGHLSVAEINEQMRGKILSANANYQRSAGIWPNAAKSYFIDTIVNSYPFQSVYFHEYVSKETKRIRRDIVDGQQRLTTIYDFLNDGFRLTSNASGLRGNLFSDLDDDLQHKILGYQVPVITITQSDPNEILEMFRRMNAFTAPLNNAEKRHSGFNGKFKWFINELAKEFSPMFHTFGILTQKQIVRMSDAELLTDFVDLSLNGIQDQKPTVFTHLYRHYDVNFTNEEELAVKLVQTLTFIRANLGSIANTFSSKSYVVYSLVAALVHNKWGVPKGLSDLGSTPTGNFTVNTEFAIRNIAALAAAHESRDLDGPYAEYVRGCVSTTHRKTQRLQRTRWLIKALNCEM